MMAHSTGGGGGGGAGNETGGPSCSPGLLGPAPIGACKHTEMITVYMHSNMGNNSCYHSIHVFNVESDVARSDF